MSPKRGPLRPTLPTSLLEQVGGKHAQMPSRSRSQHQSRKDRRKQDRVHKRQRTVPHRTLSAPIRKPASQQTSASSARKQLAKTTKPKAKAVSRSVSDVEKDEEEDDDEQDDGGFDGFSGDDDNDDSDSDSDSDSDNDVSEDNQPSQPIVSQAIKQKLAKEDAEIAELERKLGIKNRKSLPKSFQEDGLGDILGDLNEHDDEDDAMSARKKRKAEADEWLAQKRSKAARQAASETSDASDNGLDGLDNLLEESASESENDFDDDDDDGTKGNFDSDNDDVQGSGPGAVDEDEPVRKRENPYVAPVPKEPVQKYIPPARRQDTGPDAEVLSRIRRQTQGLINRLTEPNLLVILSEIEKLYREYPRQHVTSILIDLILVQICEPTSLPDTLLILYAGFSTAAYQVIGTDFGTQLIQHTVERFDDYHAQIPEKQAQNVAKYTSNLVTFISQMYNFQLIGCTILFDYIRLLLGDLTELNAELLLRMVRMAGQALRRDDPLALKDIVALLGPAVKKVGEANLSVRTKFLIDSIKDLKNNKVKTGACASAIVQEHMTRVKKLLGSMNNRKLKATEPLRLSLKDIEDSEKRGKWWLVGASWTGREEADEKPVKANQSTEEDDELDGIILSSDDEKLPDLHSLAREQNMNTDVRRSIFVTIMSSLDYEDAYARLMKLRLNKHRRKELAYVLVQCVGSEKQYNPYYAYVAKRICGDNRIKFAFQDSLWKFLRRLGETPFGEDADDEDEDEDEDLTIDARRILSVAKMFGFLVANGSIGLSVLKCISLAYVKPKARDFVEVLLNTFFLEVKKAGNSIANIFGAVADMPELSKGLQYFLKKRTQKSDLVASKKDGKTIKRRAQKAIDALKTDSKIQTTAGLEE